LVLAPSQVLAPLLQLAEPISLILFLQLLVLVFTFTLQLASAFIASWAEAFTLL
jgi:hypothetical protein